ncbi:helix-turn-helix domain-containing protein, partial [Achromobacter xylosoxidans]|uniref:helix-turn-helix domain-containing protein n=1 Tax=Alcaligenes xylosoxydans xylosoxydans TaxID=85698 RepID=UPI001F0FEE2C
FQAYILQDKARLADLLRRAGAAGYEALMITVDLPVGGKREREVLGLLCQGHDDDGIARQLRLSRNTVRNHVATIYSKIGV